MEFKKSLSWPAVLLMSAAALVVLGIGEAVGAATISWRSIFTGSLTPDQVQILLEIRFPRVLAAFCTGSGLSVAGLVFQRLFRNPLATPYTLGVSSGAACAAVLYFTLLSPFSILGIPASSFFSLGGALLTIALIGLVARRKMGAAGPEILLVGAVIGLFFSSFILMFQYVSDYGALLRTVRWLTGGFESVTLETVWILALFIVPVTLLVWWHGPVLDLLGLGEEIATTRGVETEKVKRRLLFLISLMVGGIVSVTGPIGFVGLIVPNALRLVFGQTHRTLVFTSVVCGGSFLVLCDALGRIVVAPQEVPVGVVTALLGAPIFIWLLMYRGIGQTSAHS